MAFENECLKLRNEGARLPRLVKAYQKYSPLVDEQVLLAGVINILTSHGIKISKSDIYYCFKKNYNPEYHGAVQSYLTWLYSLSQPSNKTSYSSISEAKEGLISPILKEIIKYTPKSHLSSYQAEKVLVETTKINSSSGQISAGGCNQDIKMCGGLE